LSLQRATAVADYLAELYGIDRQRLIITGAGGKHASGNDAAQNRRVNFSIITDRENFTIAEKWNSRKEFLFSHNDWETSDITRIITLDQNSLIWDEAGGAAEFVPAYGNN